MKTKAIVAGAVVVVILLFLVMLLSIYLNTFRALIATGLATGNL